jgi:hypothetical protein
MPDWLQTAIQDGEEIPLAVLCVRLLAAFALGALVALIYSTTHKKDETYQPGFVTTLVLLSILIAVVTQVIGQNVARAFSLVGALAIVRFRTVVADTRDTAFVIFAVVEGMAVGAGHFTVGLAGLVVGGAAAILMRGRGGEASPSWRLTVRIGIGHDPSKLDPVLARHFASRDLVASSTTRQGAALELAYLVGLAPKASAEGAIAEINGVPGVQQADLIRA